MNLYHVTKFSPCFSFTVYCFYTKISSFMPVLSTRIVLDCFYLLIFYSEKFSTDVCRLPYAVNVNLNLSNNEIRTYYVHVRLILIKPWYLHANSPHWSSYIALKNKLRESDKRSKHFSLGDHFIYSHKLFFYYVSILLGEYWCWSPLALNSRIKNSFGPW